MSEEERALMSILLETGFLLRIESPQVLSYPVLPGGRSSCQMTFASIIYSFESIEQQKVLSLILAHSEVSTCQLLASRNSTARAHTSWLSN